MMNLTKILYEIISITRVVKQKKNKINNIVNKWSIFLLYKFAISKSNILLKFFIIILLYFTYKKLLDPSCSYIFWVLKWQISGSRFLNHKSVVKRGFSLHQENFSGELLTSFFVTGDGAITRWTVTQNKTKFPHPHYHQKSVAPQHQETPRPPPPPPTTTTTPQKVSGICQIYSGVRNPLFVY